MCQGDTRDLTCQDLCRACLGRYELQLAYMVLAHSQRDPGEYLLELQQLASHPEGPLRQFAINMHLRRTSAALANLLAAGDDHFQRALTLAREEVLSLVFNARSYVFSVPWCLLGGRCCQLCPLAGMRDREGRICHCLAQIAPNF